MFKRDPHRKTRSGWVESARTEFEQRTADKARGMAATLAERHPDAIAIACSERSGRYILAFPDRVEAWKQTSAPYRWTRKSTLAMEKVTAIRRGMLGYLEVERAEGPLMDCATDDESIERFRQAWLSTRAAS